MKVYFTVGSLEEINYMNVGGLTSMLVSYHYFKQHADAIKMWNEKIDMFIDSGAYSAMTQNKPIDIDEYCEYLKFIDAKVYAGLDVIGDPIKTKENIEYMEKVHKLNPIPTFHMKEDIKYLETMVEKYDYIALGGMVYADGIENWLSKVWNYIYKVKPELKVHAFGITTVKHLVKYPWYSVDSTTHVSGRRFGRMILFDDHKKTITDERFKVWIRKFGTLAMDPTFVTDLKWQRALTDIVAARAYRNFIDSINDQNRDYTYLKQQQTLFDKL